MVTESIGEFQPLSSAAHPLFEARPEHRNDLIEFEIVAIEPKPEPA